MIKARTPCHRLTFDEAVEIQLRLMRGDFHSRIASHYDVNQGRIAEVKSGKTHPGSYVEALRRRKAA